MTELMLSTLFQRAEEGYRLSPRIYRVETPNFAVASVIVSTLRPSRPVDTSKFRADRAGIRAACGPVLYLSGGQSHAFQCGGDFRI
jgi:hypothetical protein